MVLEVEMIASKVADIPNATLLRKGNAGLYRRRSVFVMSGSYTVTDLEILDSWSWAIWVVHEPWDPESLFHKDVPLMCVEDNESQHLKQVAFRSRWKAEYLFCSFFGRTDTICCISQHYLGFWPRIAALHTPHEGIGALRVSCWMRSWDCQGSQADDVDVYIHAYDRSTR